MFKGDIELVGNPNYRVSKPSLVQIKMLCRAVRDNPNGDSMLICSSNPAFNGGCIRCPTRSLQRCTVPVRIRPR